MSSKSRPGSCPAPAFCLCSGPVQPFFHSLRRMQRTASVPVISGIGRFMGRAMETSANQGESASVPLVARVGSRRGIFRSSTRRSLLRCSSSTIRIFLFPAASTAGAFFFMGKGPLFLGRALLGCMRVVSSLPPQAEGGAAWAWWVAGAMAPQGACLCLARRSRETSVMNCASA
jgi:hypothetical protein